MLDEGTATRGGVMPGRIRYEDLPPKVAAKIAGRTGRQKRVRGSAHEGGRSNRYRCHTCGAEFTDMPGERAEDYWPAACEHHADTTGHRRIELVW
jgi:hypothetical protein